MFLLMQISYILVLGKKSFKVSKQESDSIINMQAQTAQSVLFRIYEFVTGRKVNVDRRLGSTLPPQQQPLYKKPTASHVAKNRQLGRIIDNKEKELRTKTFISKHQNHIHTQKYNTGLIEWLIDKRKSEIHKEVQRQRTELETKTRKLANNEQKIEVKEIELKCFNSSTSKKNKGEYGDFIDTKGVIEFLTESCSLLFKRENVALDLKRMGIELREKEISNLNIIEELLHRSDELDSKGNTKLSPETLNRLLEQFKKTSELNLIMQNINSNFIDYKKFFLLFQKPLVFYNKQTESFKLVISVITTVARGLSQKHSGENAEMMFYELFLQVLLKIGENENKRPIISSLILDFVRKESQCYNQVIDRVKTYYSGNIKVFSSYLALFIEKISKDCDEIQYNLWSEFFYYGFLAIHNTSPNTRVNGTKIISRLFSDVIIVSDDMVNEKLPILQKLILDPWWEVRAQTLIIFKAILMSQFKNQSSSEESINQGLNTKTIEHYINSIFKPDVSHNILRIGLIELAELLNFKESFCARYLEILLHVGVQIRTDVLTTSVIKFGPVVYGANTYNYQLTGAPLVWNALGIAKELKNHIKRQNIQVFQLSHLEILHACLSNNTNISTSTSQWVNLFDELKPMIFEAFMSEDLCGLGLSIIKQFLSVKKIHSQILAKSRTEITRLLNKVYCAGTGKQKTQENILQLLSFLKEEESEYTYKIMKDFAEREKNKYLESNLIDFMNELSRERRKLIFNE